MNAEESTSLALVELKPDWSLSFHASPILLLLTFAAIILFLIFRIWRSGLPFRNFELDEAEFGIGDHKVKLKPNYADRQLAYAIWVELSTRKVGLQIDLDHDVVSDVYSSWYEFFGVTRELIKGIPVSRVDRDSTLKVVNLSIELLNEGLRPHLTRWNAIFKRWFERELQSEGNIALSPQEIQRAFPKFDELQQDLLDVNRRLIAYRKKMRELALKN